MPPACVAYAGQSPTAARAACPPDTPVRASRVMTRTMPLALRWNSLAAYCPSPLPQIFQRGAGERLKPNGQRILVNIEAGRMVGRVNPTRRIACADKEVAAGTRRQERRHIVACRLPLVAPWHAIRAHRRLRRAPGQRRHLRIVHTCRAPPAYLVLRFCAHPLGHVTRHLANALAQ